MPFSFFRYTSLVELVEHIFPPYKSLSYCEMDDGYNNFEFWREPLPAISGSENKMEEQKPMGRPRSNTVA